MYVCMYISEIIILNTCISVLNPRIVHNVNILGDHTASISLENASRLVESGLNSYSAEIKLDQMAPAEHTKQETPITPRLKIEKLAVSEQMMPKVASPRADPSEGAGDTIAA